MFCDLIRGGLDSEADVFKSAVGRQHSGIEQNIDIEAKVLSVGVYLISGYRCSASLGGFPACGCQWRAGVVK